MLLSILLITALSSITAVFRFCHFTGYLSDRVSARLVVSSVSRALTFALAGSHAVQSQLTLYECLSIVLILVCLCCLI